MCFLFLNSSIFLCASNEQILVMADYGTGFEGTPVMYHIVPLCHIWSAHMSDKQLHLLLYILHLLSMLLAVYLSSSKTLH